MVPEKRDLCFVCYREDSLWFSLFFCVKHSDACPPGACTYTHICTRSCVIGWGHLKMSATFLMHLIRSRLEPNYSHFNLDHLDGMLMKRGMSKRSKPTQACPFHERAHTRSVNGRIHNVTGTKGGTGEAKDWSTLSSHCLSSLSLSCRITLHYITGA